MQIKLLERMGGAYCIGFELVAWLLWGRRELSVCVRVRQDTVIENRIIGGKIIGSDNRKILWQIITVLKRLTYIHLTHAYIQIHFHTALFTSGDTNCGPICYLPVVTIFLGTICGSTMGAI